MVAATIPATVEAALYIAGPSIGVQRSDDRGETWHELNDDLPSQNVIAFTAHRQQAETLYAVIADDGIYQSDNCGETWDKKDSGPSRVVSRLIHSDMEGSMQTGWLYAVSDDAVRLSMDCFCGWRPTGELDAGRVYDVAYDINEPERVFVTTEQGLFSSDDGGQEWQPVESRSGAHEEKVALVVTASGLFYALDRDGNLWRSDDRGQRWEEEDA